jgi:hypothetical protein
MAGWLPAVPVYGPAIKQVVFDAHDVPWVTFAEEMPYPAINREFIARLTDRYRFSQVQRVPVVPGDSTWVSQLLLDPNDSGYLRLGFTPPEPEEVKVPPVGVAIATWRPGESFGHPLKLTGETSGGLSMAIGPSGTAVVLWVPFGKEETVDVARVRSGHLLGTQKIPIASGHVPNSMGVRPSPAGGFTSSWTLRAGEELGGAAEFEVMAVDDALAPPTGIFGSPVLTPLDTQAPGAAPVSDATLVSDARGDQAVLWGTRRQGVPCCSEEAIYVASRRAGQPFDAPQLIGHGAFVNSASQLVMGPTGRITAVWERHWVGSGAGTGTMVVGGYAGRPLDAARPLWAGSATQESYPPRLAVTSRGQAIAMWVLRPRSPQPAVFAATSNDGVRFSAPRRLSIGGHGIHGCGTPHAEEPHMLVADRAGGALAGWSCIYKIHRTVQEYAYYRP